MGNGQASASPGTGLPVASFPKQAVVVIHGMGEQMPMDTIKGFVHAAWETVTDLTANGLPNPAEVWSKPDVRTGSLELRRITTRQSIVTPTFATGVRSDFYELYWADLSGGSTWNQVQDWIIGLLWRNPFTRVPRRVFLAWIILWLIALSVIVLAVATALPDPANIGSFNPWDYPPLKYLRNYKGWQLGLLAAALVWVASNFIVPYFGRVVRYTRAKPDNIAARKNIRERGLGLLAELHDKEYERIIVVGHSLGSILAYDLISYFWANRPAARVVVQGSAEFTALKEIEAALVDPTWPAESAVTAYREAQTKFAHLLRCRPTPANKDAADRRWLITDLVTLGSPLSHAEFLMASSKADLKKRRDDREYPTSPPLREELDPATIIKAKQAGFALDANDPKLLAFPFGANMWQLHHAAPFAAVRWTNIYDPAFLVAFGDLISGPVAPVFGHGIIDKNLRKIRRCQSWRFTHTRYWTVPSSIKRRVPERIKQLREALDLGGQGRRL
jgi:hypothetical protein